MTEISSYSASTIEKGSNKISIPFSASKKYYGIDNIFESNNIYLVLRKFYNKTSEENYQKNWIKTTSEILNEEKFEWKTISSAIMLELKKELKNRNLELKDISEIWIQEWKMILKLNNWEKIYFNLDAKSLNELVVKQELQEVKEEVEKNISSYVIWWAIFTLTLLPTAQHEWKRILKIILDQKWKKLSLDLNEEIKWEITDKKILKLVEKNWVEYNSKTWKFEIKNPLDKIKVSFFNKSLENLKYETFKKNLEKAWIKEIPTEEEFKQIKTKWQEFIINIAEKSKKTKWSFWKLFEKEFFRSLKESINLEKIWEKSMHYALLPIFIQEIHKHTGSTQSYMEAWTEVVWFYSWAALAWRLLSLGWPKHPLVMLVWSLAGWTVWTMIGKHTLESFDKELLDFNPNKDIEDWTKSVDVQIISMWTIYDFLDKINYDFTETWIDMSNNINASTNPEFYLAKRFWWVEHWNKELKEYKNKTIKKIDEFLYKDFRYSDILKDKESLKKWLFNVVSLSEEYKLDKESWWSKQRWLNKKNKEKRKKINIIVWKVSNFIENNLPKNIYCWDDIEYPKFEEKFELFLKSLLINEDIVEMIIVKFRKMSEAEFVDSIASITWMNKDLIQEHIWNSGKESEFMNDIQRDSLKRLDDFIYLEYSRYKKEAIVDYNINEYSFKVNDEATEKARLNANFIKNMSSNIIENNNIDTDYIETYKENISNKKWFLELAFEWKLTKNIKWEEWKYVVQTDWITSYVPVKKESWEIKKEIFHENIDDVLYINSLSDSDRNFIKTIIYDKILKWESIIDYIKEISNEEWYVDSIDNHITISWEQLINIQNLEKFKKLIQNLQFYNFYKRMLILVKQNFFIKNIEEHWDAVYFDEENSWLLHPINNFRKKVNKILDNQCRIKYNKSVFKI